MSLRIALASSLAVAASAHPVAAQERTSPSIATDTAIVGRYAYRDREIVGHLDLRRDHGFDYRVDGTGPAVAGEAPFSLRVRGVWRITDRGTIVLTNAPTTPPIFRQVAAVRDPGVRAAFTIVSTDGKPVETLGLRIDDGADRQLHMVPADGWTLPLRREWDSDEGKTGEPTRLPESWEIVRASDDRSLVKIALSADGPNRFTFRYTPSPIEPFELAARPVTGQPGTMEVEFGTASVVLHKVAD